MIDRAEAQRRGQLPRQKSSTNHPYAAIEHRVIDSPAYADLTFSAQALLLLIARQLTKDNNGHLQAAHSYVSKFGFGSERTLARAIKELVAHGMIYRTRCGGYQKGPSMYAVTWLKIKRPQGLFLEGYLHCAWRHWEASEKKSPPAKVQACSGLFGMRAPSEHAKSAGDSPRKKAAYELMPVHRSVGDGERVPL